MKMYVCGCSFLSCDQGLPSTHFSEIISKSIGYDLVSLARQGISNSAIRLQIQRSVDNKADLVIFNGTTSDRFEILLNRLWSHLEDKSYVEENGIDNFEYRFYPNTSKNNINNEQRSSMFSDHYSKFTSDEFDADFVHSWKHFITHIYHEPWKKQQDQWIIESSLNLLLQSAIPFVYLPMYGHVPKWLPQIHIYDRPNKILLDFQDNSPACYHTTPDNQLHFSKNFLPWLENYLKSQKH